jgi:uncharacterized Zn-finger protein
VTLLNSVFFKRPRVVFVDLLLLAMNSHTMDSSALKCGACQKAFSHARNLKRHVQTAHEKKGDGFKCEKCGRGFTRKEKLVIHNGKCNPEKYKCRVCPSAFGWKKDLRIHTLATHGRKSFECKKCTKKSNRPRNRDVRTKIGSERSPTTSADSDGPASAAVAASAERRNIKVKCKDCTKEFQTTTLLKRHIATMHEKIKIKCKFCGKECSRQDVLKNHFKICKAAPADAANKKIKLKCECCGKEYGKGVRTTLTTAGSLDPAAPEPDAAVANPDGCSYPL